LTGTNYAISFILLQVFGLALATKQPSATAATFAGIVRNNPGNASWSKISDFTARISRTQLAAAIGNVIAVCIGAVALERLWRVMFAKSYLPEESARHVYDLMGGGAHRRLVRKFRRLSSPDRSRLPTSLWPSCWTAQHGAPGGLD
jgi:sugar (pentulose or hexulose) kinase